VNDVQKQINIYRDINHTRISRTFVFVAKRWTVSTHLEKLWAYTGNSASIQTGWPAETQLEH